MNDLFDNYANNTKFQLQISNLEKKREALDIIIGSKKECARHRNRPIDIQNKKEIEKVISKLQRLKKDQKANLTFCEGVALKLEEQLRKVLKAFNYSYACMEGLEDAEQERVRLNQRLKDLKGELEAIDYRSNLGKIRKYFNNSMENKIHIMTET